MTRATTLRSDDATVAICSYTLREGDNIRRLARAIGTTVDTILAMNERQSTKEIHPGETIYLPVRARELGSLLVDAQMYYAGEKLRVATPRSLSAGGM